MSNKLGLSDRIRRHLTGRVPVPTHVQPVLPRLNGIRAVFIDVYGTILTSGAGDLGIHESADNVFALQEALAAAGFDGDLPEASRIGAKLLESTIREDHAFTQAWGIAHPEVEIRDIWRRVVDLLARQDLLWSLGDKDQRAALAVEYEMRVNPVAMMPGARDALGVCATNGMPVGIVSNSQFYTPLILDCIFAEQELSGWFDSAISVWSYRELLSKPSVVLYELAAARLLEQHGILPTACLYIGNDLLKDVWAAREAGFKTALFAGDATSLRLREDDPRCTELQPDAVLTDWRQLGEIL